MDKWNKVDWIRKTENEIENHKAIIDALTLVKNVAKDFNGKVINRRFFNKVETQSKDNPSDKFPKYFLSWYEYGDNEIKIYINNFSVNSFEREVIIYNLPRKYGEKQPKYITADNRLDYDMLCKAIEKIIQSQQDTIADKENGLKNLDDYILQFRTIREKYIEITNKIPICLRPTSEIYIEMPINEANTRKPIVLTMPSDK